MADLMIAMHATSPDDDRGGAWQLYSLILRQYGGHGHLDCESGFRHGDLGELVPIEVLAFELWAIEMLSGRPTSFGKELRVPREGPRLQAYSSGYGCGYGKLQESLHRTHW
jgi:hypothetical protein